jgi:tRNA 2-thiouridine synthesizing protein D
VDAIDFSITFLRIGDTKMTVFTVVVMEAPYGRERAYTALRFALAAALEGHKVRTFLIQDGVFVAKKGQSPEQFPNLAGLLEDALREGVEVKMCTPCCKARALTDAEVVKGVAMATMSDLVEWCTQSDKVLTF